MTDVDPLAWRRLDGRIAIVTGTMWRAAGRART
jgi:hypothetical protein